MTMVNCILLFLLAVSCTLLAFSTFFSDQLPWRPTSLLMTSPSPSPAAQGPTSSSATPTDLSHIVFAIGGSAHTWDRRRVYSELWWRPNHTLGHVWLDRAPTTPWPHTCPPYWVSRDTSRYGARASASRIANIVAEAYRLVEKEKESQGSVRWLVMGDDDTVFFVENLVGVLQKYDHHQMYYIGMPSESVEQDVMHSYGMAFGGGGFAISYPAAAELAGIMGACLDRYAYFYGSDQRVQSCLAELGVPLTREPGFHQVDVRGDVYGMLAAHPLAPLVSLHHLDYVKPIMGPIRPNQLESLQALFSAYQADPARILQQVFCYIYDSEDAGRRSVWTWSVSVSWGYTIQVYPWAVPARELEIPLQTFKTWRSSRDGPFIFNTRPLHADDPCNRPFIFFLDRVNDLHTKEGTLTEYTSSKNDNTKCEKPGFSDASRINKVQVFAPKMDPSLWKQAPRRHCCTTRRKKGGKILEVRIKYCS